MDDDLKKMESRQDRVELIAAILIGLAAVLTAFATFQSGVLAGQVRDAHTEALAETSFANDIYNDANAERSIERDWFFGWLVEDFNGRPAADFLHDAMDPKVWALIQEWRAAEFDGILDPFSDEAQEAYTSYGELPSVDKIREGNLHMDNAESAILRGRVADKRGGWFDLSTVFLAITLVTGGIAALLKSRTAQRLVLGTAIFCLVLGAGLLMVGFV